MENKITKVGELEVGKAYRFIGEADELLTNGDMVTITLFGSEDTAMCKTTDGMDVILPVKLLEKV